jgi:hypothetical protein
VRVRLDRAQREERARPEHRRPQREQRRSQALRLRRQSRPRPRPRPRVRLVVVVVVVVVLAREAVSTRGAVTAASNDVARSLLRARFPRARRRGGEAPKIEVGEATHRDASRRIATRGGR